MNMTLVASALRSLADALEAPAPETSAPAPTNVVPMPGAVPVPPATTAPVPPATTAPAITANDIFAVYKEGSTTNPNADQVMMGIMQRHGIQQMSQAPAELLPTLLAETKAAFGLGG